MAKVGKIGVGVNDKLNFHDFKHDVNSTLGFGFCEPTLIHSMHAKSKIDLQTKSLVRLAPLPCPTFGRMKAKTDTVFVPMIDVFEAWNEFVTGTGYTTRYTSGVPTTVDYITFHDLFNIMLNMGCIDSYNADTFKLDNINTLFKQMFTFSFSINWNIFSDGDEMENDWAPSNWTDLDVLMSSATTPKGKQRALRFLSQFISICTSYGNDSVNLSDYLEMNEFITNSNEFFSEFDASAHDGLYWIFLNANKGLHSFFKPSYFENADMRDRTGFFNELPDLATAFNNAPDVVKSIFDMPRTHENYDYSFVYTPGNVIHWANKDAFDHDSDDENINSIDNTQSEKYKVCLNFHLTPYGKRIMKIINAMGVTSRFNDNIELPKLFAYYKAWFDLYDPQRNKQWKQTNAFKLIHNFFDFRVTTHDWLNHYNTPPYTPHTVCLSIFRDFIIDLVKCNYYFGADTITVANRYPLQPASGDIDDPNILQGLTNVAYQGRSDGNVFTVSSAEQGFGTQSSTDGLLTSISVIALERLYYAINKESALASNIEDIMRTRFGVDIKSTRILGRSDYDIEIDPVFGTVNNDQTMLGEYAGKSVANGSTGDIKFTAPVQGYVIQLFSIVPYGGYVQGSIPAQIERGDFYNDFTAMYDSLGYEPLRKSQVLGRESVINNFETTDSTFGFVPQMFHLKYRNNLANGGFSFHSERNSFLPYSLDRIFSEGEINDSVSTTLGNNSPSYSKPIDVVPDPIMRTVGLYEGFGNYDRIFYDTTGLSDNFILHMIQDLKYYSPMKSISQSFDTFDKDVDDDVREVERS